MSADTTTASFRRETDIALNAPILIEGLPGHGLVASITAELITEQLALEPYGAIRSEAFYPIASFTNGLVQDPVRVYAGTTPAVMTLQSDIPIPPSAFSGLRQCVLDELSAEFSRAVFLAGALAQSDAEVGEVAGVATTDVLMTELMDAGIDIATTPSAVGGVTGALVSACYEAGVPAVLLLVRAKSNVPDPIAAASVIDTAIEPIVGFDIDTAPLRDQENIIREEKQQIAQRFRQMNESVRDVPVQTESMYQ